MNLFATLIYIPFVNILVALIVWLPGHSAAVAIIAFTVLLRIVLLLPNRHALENQKKIQTLQPEIDRLSRDYKDEPQRRAEALMALYKENNISPFGSCLPLLIQLPVLIILYRILQAGFTDATLSVLYPFVPRPDMINNHFFGLDLTQPDHTYILPVTATLLQVFQTVIMLTPARRRGQKTPGQAMFYFMSLTILLIAQQINGGAVLYWVTSTLFGIGQQLAVNRRRTEVVHANKIDPPPTHRHQSKKEDSASTKSSLPPTQKRGRGGVTVTVKRPRKNK